MSKSDKANFSGSEWDADKPWHYRTATGYHDNSRKKLLKRLAAKRNRKRAVPHTSMRGYGWGDENYKYT